MTRRALHQPAANQQGPTSRRRPWLSALAVAALLAGCVESAPRPGPRLEQAQPDRWREGSPVLLRVDGEELGDGTQAWRLGLQPVAGDGTGEVALLDGTRLSGRLLLGRAPAGLPAGQYRLVLHLEGEFPQQLAQVLTVLPADTPDDIDGPLVWLSEPDPRVGVRAGSLLQLRVEATDPAGVASLGFEALGLVAVVAEREVSTVDETAFASFRLRLPADLRPLSLFWLVPRARDRLGNRGYGPYATSVIICGEPDGQSLEFPCPAEPAR